MTTTPPMEHVQVDPLLFTKERNNYYNWPLAFWRELAQNSRDAILESRRVEGEIDISITGSDGKYQIKFDDNGCGMDEDVLRNVFFRLGATTKNTTATEGGFGKARMLVCFANESYQIDTHNCHVVGSYGMYRIENRPWRRGCCVTIDLDAHDKYGSAINMMDKLQQYLSMSYFRGVTVRVNGREWTDWSYCNRLTRELSFGKVYANKSGRHEGILIVRLNGAMMFSNSVRCKHQVIVELNPETAREVLVSNRDGLQIEQNNELNAFIQEIAVDTRSALRGKDKYITWYGSEVVATRRPAPKSKPEPEPVAEAAFTTVAAPFEPDKVVDELNRGAARTTPRSIAKRIDEEERMLAVDELIPSTAIIMESENPKVRRVARSYLPDAWTSKVGGKKKKLLKLWAVACQFAVEEFLEWTKKDVLFWRPAFLFDDVEEGESDGAKHLKDGNGRTCFALNPVDKYGKMRYRLRSKADRSLLVSIAAHEVCHELISYHDESFACLQTYLTGKIFARIKEIERAMTMVLGRR